MEACACCGYQTIGEKGCFEICPICYWEDDAVQESDPWFSVGANKPSLYQAQVNYKLYGAMEERFQKNVRKINPQDLKCSTWRLLVESDNHFAPLLKKLRKPGVNPNWLLITTGSEMHNKRLW